MLTTKRKPAGVGEILIEEFMRPMGLTQGALAEAMGVQRKHVNELCNDPPQCNRADPGTGVRQQRRFLAERAAATGSRECAPDGKLRDLWEAMNSPRERARIKRARPLRSAA